MDAITIDLHAWDLIKAFLEESSILEPFRVSAVDRRVLWGGWVSVSVEVVLLEDFFGVFVSKFSSIFEFWEYFLDWFLEVWERLEYSTLSSDSWSSIGCFLTSSKNRVFDFPDFLPFLRGELHLCLLVEPEFLSFF